MREIKFRAWDNHYKEMLLPVDINLLDKFGIKRPNVTAKHNSPDLITMQYTGYKMFSKDVFFDDIVSNNFKTDKEVIRQIVMNKGCIMMKRVKGKSSLPKYISLHEWHQLNFKVIGNIHENKDLL